MSMRVNLRFNFLCLRNALERTGLLLLCAVCLHHATARGDGLFWTNHAGAIQRSELDGTQVQDVITGINNPSGLAIDPICRQIYWHSRDEKIERASLDGTGVSDVLDTGGMIGSIALDLVGNRLYATSGFVGMVRARLDGSAPLFVVADGISLSGIAIDADQRKLYWNTGSMIRRSNLAGSNIEDLVTTSSASNLAVDSAGGKLYFKTSSGIIGQISRIWQTNLDGSDLTLLLEINGSTSAPVRALEFDPVDRLLYYTEAPSFSANAGRISRIDPNSLVRETILTGLDSFLRDVRVFRDASLT